MRDHAPRNDPQRSRLEMIMAEETGELRRKIVELEDLNRDLVG